MPSRIMESGGDLTNSNTHLFFIGLTSYLMARLPLTKYAMTVRTTALPESQGMELSNDVQLLLDGCRSMNCIYEGQSFSRNLVLSACADPKSSEHALEEMLEKGLAVKTATGAYGSTSVGVSALQSAPKPTRHKMSSRTAHQSRPPINKL